MVFNVFSTSHFLKKKGNLIMPLVRRNPYIARGLFHLMSCWETGKTPMYDNDGGCYLTIDPKVTYLSPAGILR